MRSKRNRHDRPLIRPIPALIALITGLVLPFALAHASTTFLGQTNSSPDFVSNSGVLAASTAPGSSSYTTPDGVLTKWRYHSADQPSPGRIKLKIFRKTPNPHEYQVIGDSSFKSLSQGKGYEFDEQISVKQGDILGLYTDNGARVAFTTPAPPGNSMGHFETGELKVGEIGTTSTEFPNYRVDVEATVESDADKDGYGDDTQDSCPNDPKTHSGSKCSTTTTTVKDNTRPKVSLSRKGKQNLVKQHGVFVTAASNENGKVDASGTVSIERVVHVSKTYKLAGTVSTITAGAKKTLFLRASKKLRRKVKRALRHGRRVHASVRVRVTDAAGNRTSKTTTIKIKRRGS